MTFSISPSTCFQGHPEARRDADGPPEEDHDQRAADESAGPQQECAFCARITPTMEVSFGLKTRKPQVAHEVLRDKAEVKVI